MTRKTWIIFIAVVMVLLGGLIWLSRGEKIDTSNIDALAVQQPSNDNGNIGEHTLGNPDAKIVIIEFADYQCPGCSAAAPALKKVTQDYPDDVLLVYRNFPLTSIHPNSRAASAAAEAAGLQGKFWEMHHLLFENKDSWGSATLSDRNSYFVDYATTLGLDIDKFNSDVSSDAVSKKIDYDTALAKKLERTGTPSIYVNGEFADYQIKDGKRIDTYDSTANYVWSSADLFDEFAIKPLLETQQ